MLLECGETTGTDLQRLRAPLQEPLTSLADLERHMNKFMLASKTLTATGHGKNPYEYFETFLKTVRGFPVVAQTLSTFYVAHPAIAQHTIATLLPHLKAQNAFMMAQSTASPFSGAATPAPALQPNKKNNTKRAEILAGGKEQTGAHNAPRTPRSTHPTFPEASLNHPWYPQPWLHWKPSTAARSRGSPRCLPPTPSPTLSLYSTVLLPVMMATSQPFLAGQQDNRQVVLALSFAGCMAGTSATTVRTVA
jgi:hypothetical protein